MDLTRKQFDVLVALAEANGALMQRELEELSGVSQPVIARMESGVAVPKLDTVIKILAALGKTLAIVPLETVRPAK